MPEEKNGVHIQDLGEGPLWNIDLNALSSLTTIDLNKFHLTWAINPEGIDKKFYNADSLHSGGDLLHLEGKNNGSLPTLFNSKYNYRIENTYHTLDCVPVDWAKDKNKHREVIYRYNNDWFRSEHFKKTHDGLHVLFSGCSNTEGIGANIENTWSYMLYEKISKEHKLDGYYNLGQSGGGIETIIHNITKYINEYGSPDIIFMLLPNILRGWSWKKEESRWYYEQINPWQENPVKEDTILKHRSEFPRWIFIINTFLNYCKDKNIKIIWSTWDTWETDNIKLVETFRETFLPISKITMNDLETKYASLLTREDAMEARDGHDGYVTQAHWYNNFYNAIISRGLLNDIN